MSVSLVILAAGLSTRYGRLKQLDPVGPSGEALMDYGIFDAVRAGVDRVVPVVREEIVGEVADHVGALVGDAAEVEPALQELADVPAWFAVPERRGKPWGTGHAVLAAREALDRPFLVMNADDFYGREAFGRLVGWAAGRAGRAGRAGGAGAAGAVGAVGAVGSARASGSAGSAGSAAPAEAALVPYRLRDSLSAHGGVSRAVLEVGPDGTLEAIREVFRIREAEGEGGAPSPPGGGGEPLVGEERDGRTGSLTGEELFSANLWGFGPEVLPLLEEGFASFLHERGEEPDAEYLVADGLRPALREGRLRVRVLERGRTWLGVTHPEDRPDVAARLREWVEAGIYPPDLRASLSGGGDGQEAASASSSPAPSPPSPGPES